MNWSTTLKLPASIFNKQKQAPCLFMLNKNALEQKVQGQAVCNVGLKLPQFQCHTSAAWAIVHVTMGFNELIEGEHFYVQRQQHPVGG